jgi:lactate dehydrogenase-like 2-hydroxyacid dehydrogenase
MRVVYADNHANVESIELEIAGHPMRVGVKHVTLDELLAQSDAISLHVPAQPGGQPVLGAEQLRRTKPGVVIVKLAFSGENTSLMYVQPLLSHAPAGLKK